MTTTRPAPFLFCDVDGVLNARDRELGTAGNAHDYDSALHYDMDGSIVFEGHSWTFYWSEEMVSQLRDLIETGQVEFMWTTNWQQYATRRLNPLFRFPQGLGHTPISYNLDDSSQSYKGRAIVEHLRSLGADTRPFIWLDDIATLPYLAGRPLEQMFADEFNVPHLIIAPEERHGLSRDQMRQIREFIQEHSGTES